MSTITDEQGTDIVALVEATPVLVLTDKQKFSQFYSAMREECEAHVPDLKTEKGRKAIASLAYKVARTKTAIDEAGKKLNEEARVRINAVDEARREIRQQLDVLRDEVRRPLTDWEEAEKQREAKAAKELAFIRESARVDIDTTSADVIGRLNALSSLKIDEALHQDQADFVRAALADAIEGLTVVRDRLKREDEERAELARLRAENEAREAREREAAEAREAEERRIAAEREEAERLERIAREAEERAKAEAERKAREERERVQREHEEALAAERRRAEEAEAAAKAERDRVVAEEAARKAAAEREEQERQRREANEKHRRSVLTAAKVAIMQAGGIEEGPAKAIVVAIKAGMVPNVTISF